MLPDQLKPQYQIFLDEWMRAEEILKLTERIRNEAFIPSIKELRYAARRIVQAQIEYRSGTPNLESINVHLIEAIENCRKARHDALDSAVNFVQDQLDKLVLAVGLDTVAICFPKYTELKPQLKKVSNLIVESRKTRVTLDDQYEQIKRDHLSSICDLYTEMEVARDAIKALEKRRRNEFWKAALIIGVIISAIIGILIAVGTIILEKRGYFDGFKPTAGLNQSTPHPVVNKTKNKGVE